MKEINMSEFKKYDITITRFIYKFSNPENNYCEYSCNDLWEGHLIITKRKLREMLKYTLGCFLGYNKYKIKIKLVNASNLADPNKLCKRIILSERIIHIPKSWYKNVVELKYSHTDKGNCRIYYTGSDKNLYCEYTEFCDPYNYYICSKDGEPCSPVKRHNIEIATKDIKI